MYLTHACLLRYPNSLCHSVTITSQRPCKTQQSTPAERPDTCFQCLVSTRSEDGEHQPPPAKWPRVHRYRFDPHRYSCANILSLTFLKRATLPPVSAAPSSVPPLSVTIITAPILLLSIFIHVTSFVSGRMLLKTQGRNPFHTLVAPVNYHSIERNLASSNP